MLCPQIWDASYGPVVTMKKESKDDFIFISWFCLLVHLFIPLFLCFMMLTHCFFVVSICFLVVLLISHYSQYSFWKISNVKVLFKCIPGINMIQETSENKVRICHGFSVFWRSTNWVSYKTKLVWNTIIGPVGKTESNLHGTKGILENKDMLIDHASGIIILGYFSMHHQMITRSWRRQCDNLWLFQANCQMICTT